MTDLALVVLAAGMGTRMKSSIPKVLHKIAGRTMLSHVLHAGKALGPTNSVVVHGPGKNAVQTEARSVIAGCDFAEQIDRLGTGHAVSMARMPELHRRMLRSFSVQSSSSRISSTWLSLVISRP